MSKRIKGQVRSVGAGTPLTDLLVEVHAVPAGNAPGSLENSEQLASGRTGPDGSFTINLPDAPAAAGERNLVAAVYADDTHAGSPLAVTRPRTKLDAASDLLVRVPDARLGEAGVKQAAIPQKAPASQGAIAASLIQARDKARQSLQSATAPELTRRLRVRKKGRDLAGRLLSSPGKGVGGTRTRFVSHRASPSAALQDARSAGIKRLADIAVPGMSVHLDDAVLRSYFPDGLNTHRVPISQGALERIRSLFPSAPGARRLRDVLTMCRAERGRDDARAELAGSAPAPVPAVLPDTTDSNGSSSVATRAEFLERLRSVVLNGHGNGLATTLDIGAVERGLQINVPTGPADTTAYYDFHRLQVAWEDTWTAVLDDLTATELADLYESIVEVVDPKETVIDTSESAELEQLLQDVADAITVASSTPGISCPPDIATWLPEAADKWTALEPDQQEWIRFLKYCDELYDGLDPLSRAVYGAYTETLNQITGLNQLWPVEWCESVRFCDLGEDWGKGQAEEFLGTIASADVAEPSGLTRATRLLDGLNKRLAEPYKFDVFVPDSYNYGILTNYRQRWKPLAYQVGDLVASMPMAPGETRSFETHRVVKTTRAQKEVEKSLSSRTGESTVTGRVESEIVQKASNATNFAMAGEGSINVAIASIGASSQFGANQAADSSQTKRDLRESTEKAAREYRDERSLEVTSEESVTGETTEKRAISNPNNEITVTYLLYELQRRYEVAEQLDSVRPVVLVAFHVPQPSQIDEAWLVTYEWILRKVILHDRFLPALNYLTQGFAGEEIGVEVRKAQWDAQMAVVSTLSDNVSASARLRDASRRAMLDATEAVAEKDGLIKNLGEALFPSGPEEAEVQSAQREAAQRSLEWINADLATAQSRLEVAVNALRQATDDYCNALQQRTDRRVAIDQLRLHVKQNILYYMQAIWAHEPADQRYFRLYDLQVQWPIVDPAGYTVSAWTPPPSLVLGRLDPVPRSLQQDSPHPNVQLFVPPPTLGPERPLHQVADLDSLLGFKGNYAIFPLKEDNGITTYMSQAFFDDYFGVMDPDPFGRIPTTSEALALAECAWNKAGTTDADRTAITQWLLEIMASQDAVSNELVVPTGQLYIEALPGAHPLLETFKLEHRALDLERAVIDGKVREVELLRRAARLVQGDLSDADVDQRVEVTGGADVTVSVPPAFSGT